MEPKSHEPPPTVTDLILGQMIMAGFLLLVAAIPVGLILPLKAHGPHWDWQWSFILGAMFSIAFAALGGALMFSGWIIAKWRWAIQAKAKDSFKP